jgi:chromosome segregation ATPase
MKDIENLKETNREIRKESKEDIAELKKEIVELKEEVRRLNQLIKSIDGDNIRKDSIIMMKNQEINLLRGWINKALVTSCEKCRSKFDTVPDSFEAMPGFFDNGGSYKEPQN